VRALAFETVIACLLSAPASGADLLIVVNKSEDTVSILDAKTGVVRGSHRVGQGPHEAELLADGHTAAISNYGNRTESCARSGDIAVVAGAAAVLGAMRVIASIAPPFPVHGFLGDEF
jgi:hypothetical protein